MFKYIVKRLAQTIVVLFVVAMVVFILTNYIGDPAAALLTEEATYETIQEVREQLGLNDPLPVQFVNFIKDAVRGNFGNSYVYKQPVLQLIGERMPATLELVGITALMTLIIAIPLGVFAGAFPKSRISKLIMTGSILGISLPTFWIGMMLIYIFSVKFGVLPASGRGRTVAALGMQLSIFAPGGWRYLVMPAITLSLAYIATILRLTRTGIRENMKQDYIKFARAKGVPAGSVLFRHALKNALIPVVTVFGINIGKMFAFTTITETIFAWPGMGKLLIDAIYRSDRPIIVAYLMITSVMFVGINFIVDIIYTIIDPRIELR